MKRARSVLCWVGLASIGCGTGSPVDPAAASGVVTGCDVGAPLAGAAYDIEKSRFAFGTTHTQDDASGFVRWVGVDGVVAIEGGRTIALARSVDGINVVESLAYARLDNQDQSTSEGFYWPTIASNAIWASVRASEARASEVRASETRLSRTPPSRPASPAPGLRDDPHAVSAEHTSTTPTALTTLLS